MAVIQQPEIQAILCPLCRAANRPYARFCQQCGKDVLLDDTYRITRVIKEGGMGIVYQAVDADGAFYAIKEMHDRFTDAREREAGIQRFLEEAQLLRQLRGHPGIPQIYRSFIDEGRYYLAMEFVWGEDLEELLKRHGAFPEAQVLIWADELCDVLEHLHANGLIYRDMKPSNVMITHEGHVKVVDFGIAKLLQPGQRGTMIGTPGYSPPEQYQGITTVQSDIYALAATLHHLLTGRDPRNEPPFSFPPVRTLRPAISPQTDAALQRALALEVEKRFGSVAEFRRALPRPDGEPRATTLVEVRPPAQPVPTHTFDPPPSTRPATPRAKAAPKARPGRQYRQAWPVPPPQPLPTRAQQRSRPRRTHRPARALRRIVAVVLLALGLYYGFQVYGAQIVSLIEQYLPALNQPLPDGGQPGGDTDGAPVTWQTHAMVVMVPPGAATSVPALRATAHHQRAAQPPAGLERAAC